MQTPCGACVATGADRDSCPREVFGPAIKVLGDWRWGAAVTRQSRSVLLGIRSTPSNRDAQPTDFVRQAGQGSRRPGEGGVAHRISRCRPQAACGPRVPGRRWSTSSVAAAGCRGKSPATLTVGLRLRAMTMHYRRAVPPLFSASFRLLPRNTDGTEINVAWRPAGCRYVPLDYALIVLSMSCLEAAR